MRHNRRWSLSEIALREVFIFVLQVNNDNLFNIIHFGKPLAHLIIRYTFIFVTVFWFRHFTVVDKSSFFHRQDIIFFVVQIEYNANDDCGFSLRVNALIIHLSIADSDPFLLTPDCITHNLLVSEHQEPAFFIVYAFMLMVIDEGFASLSSFDLFAFIDIVEVECGTLVVLVTVAENNVLFPLAFDHRQDRVQMVHIRVLFHHKATFHQQVEELGFWVDSVREATLGSFTG